MKNATRRQLLLRALGLAATAAAPWVRAGSAGARVVVIGGGFGGASCARYLKTLDQSLEVILLERDAAFLTCPFSNLVLGGLREMSSISHGYTGLRAAGVNVVHDTATVIDPDRRQVRTSAGARVAYDRLVVAPGIDVRLDAVPGYDMTATAMVPHAWKAGEQTRLLRRQLAAMGDGGTVIIAAPANPFRCPPGPYERASLIAHYLKTRKPKAKVLILDAKDSFSKQDLFQQGWQTLYPGMIEWVAGSQGGIVERVDAGRRLLVTESGFTEHRGEVVNFIPPQRAGAIAHSAGLADASGWCPVNQLTFESTRLPWVHVLGDAAIAGQMPKSGFSANSQAKVCAAAIVSSLRGQVLPAASYANTCYSLVGPQYGISVSAVYRVTDGTISGVNGAGGISPADADTAFRAAEARYAHGWYASICADTWG